MYIPTMSLCELVERLRSLGIKTSNPTAAAMIEAGAYPFAQAVRLEEDPPWEYTLYTAAACARSRRFYWTTYHSQRVRYVDLPRLVERGVLARFPLEAEPDFLDITEAPLAFPSDRV